MQESPAAEGLSFRLKLPSCPIQAVEKAVVAVELFAKNGKVTVCKVGCCWRWLVIKNMGMSYF